MFHVEQSTTDNQFLEIFRAGARKLGWDFSENTLNVFLCYYRELCQWDKVVNLTSIREEREKIVLLFLDSLHGRLVLEEGPFTNIVDIGTGAGFPGIPLKILFPEKQMSLVEAKAKKAAFLVNVVGKLHLSGTRVIQQRIEDMEKSETFNEKWDLAMIKGVNPSHVIPHLRNILSERGKLLVFRSTKNHDLDTQREMKVYKEFSYELPFGFGQRAISLMEFQ